mmetsp:Transcript_19843/g.42579  ORF Transcript_19843/g.42579 Transcript_19843/m.42579 type:complete len:82 (-) Transcript_19843:85-330(-)
MCTAFVDIIFDRIGVQMKGWGCFLQGGFLGRWRSNQSNYESERKMNLIKRATCAINGMSSIDASYGIGARRPDMTEISGIV